MTTPNNILVLGVGNVLMGDEGIGVHAIAHLEKEAIPPGVTLLDGGTGGFHLLGLFEEYDPIIFIDATMDGRPAGTVTLIHPKFASDFPKTLSAHDIGLRDLLESATLLAPLPRLFLLTVSVDAIQPMVMELSAPVRDSLPRISQATKEILASLL
jgi:hydrogenase maturation protease